MPDPSNTLPNTAIVPGPLPFSLVYTDTVGMNNHVNAMNLRLDHEVVVKAPSELLSLSVQFLDVTKRVFTDTRK
ncbi:hypothetical protein L198_06768 [Cryptococcus wingfieldii CBS 7118]|uniref:Uncharacterized protein n=1 Tax=Cryptococcus wingfieldii CBS 7118 TaxID=1295528 RepID=A0A1E3IKL9_9TREE|nr:hypothetical protein L198_06768 [Cryptococcus wingfieldii CBS 7118]ODN88496.1 hypothetical protein L198_06768 [Cryptococcus wingfieldii CBS 7118]